MREVETAVAKFCAVVVPWGRERLARQLQAARRVRQKKKKKILSPMQHEHPMKHSQFMSPSPSLVVPSLIGSAQLAPSRAVRSNKLVEHCSLSLQPQGQMLHNMRKAVQDKERRRWRRTISFLRTRVARAQGWKQSYSCPRLPRLCARTGAKKELCLCARTRAKGEEVFTRER